jgi:aspartate-semialdehyde dehydrogenase
MQRQPTAILGATGAVGQELMAILAERDFPLQELKLLASPRSAGRKFDFQGEELTVQAVSPEAFEDVDIAFFCAGGSISKEYAKEAMARGTVIIDNTSAFRLDEDVPLVVPEVNASDITPGTKLVANPNCSTTIMVMALAPLHRFYGIERVVVSTYQAVSGVGASGMEDLANQVRAWVADEEIVSKSFPFVAADEHYQMAFNLVPHIDMFDEMDYTKEEWKMVRETQKILHDPNMRITATTVRVPVMRSHSESVNIEFKQEVDLPKVKELLSVFPGVIVQDDPQNLLYPMPLDVAGKDEVCVGRIRQDNSHSRAINLWVVGDQIRKGAALNAVQIGEYMVKNDLI